MKKLPVYMYQCVVCRKTVLTSDTVFRHCGKLTQWVSGIEGKGIDMKSPNVTIKVSGHITMSQESFETLQKAWLEDLHMGLVYSIHVGFTDASGLVFELPD